MNTKTDRRALLLASARTEQRAQFRSRFPAICRRWAFDRVALGLPATIDDLAGVMGVTPFEIQRWTAEGLAEYAGSWSGSAEAVALDLLAAEVGIPVRAFWAGVID